MLAWIPIIGPIIQGIVSLFNKKQDVNIEKIKASVEDNKTTASVIVATKDDLGVCIARDIVIFPVAVWSAIVSWDTIVAKHWPDLMFVVEKYPPSLEYLPYAVLAFLLGNLWINRR